MKMLALKTTKKVSPNDLGSGGGSRAPTQCTGDLIVTPQKKFKICEMNGIKLFVYHGLKKKLYLAGGKKTYEKTQKKTLH